MDIMTNDENGNPWGFDKEEQKMKAEKKVLDTCPDLFVESPMCKDFSPWQRLNEAKSSEPEKFQENKESQGIIYNSFVEIIAIDTTEDYYFYTNIHNKPAPGMKSACVN